MRTRQIEFGTTFPSILLPPTSFPPSSSSRWRTSFPQTSSHSLPQDHRFDGSHPLTSRPRNELQLTSALSRVSFPNSKNTRRPTTINLQRAGYKSMIGRNWRRRSVRRSCWRTDLSRVRATLYVSISLYLHLSAFQADYVQLCWHLMISRQASRGSQHSRRCFQDFDCCTTKLRGYWTRPRERVWAIWSDREGMIFSLYY